MALDKVTAGDGSLLPAQTRTDPAGLVKVIEGLTDFLSSGVPTTVTEAIGLPINLIQLGGVAFSLGQQLAAASVPVVLTASQLSALAPFSTVNVGNLPATQAISAAALPLPAGASSEATLAALNSKITLGQQVAATSASVVLASDQSPVPVTGSFSVSPADNITISSGTINAAGTTSEWLTTGYGLISISISGQWTGSVQVVGRDDAAFPWRQQQIQETGTSYVAEDATASASYFIRPTTKFIALSCVTITGSADFVVMGKANDGPDAGGLLLAQSFDESSGVKSQVNIAGGLNKDEKNALILSDGKTYTLSPNNGSVIVIDTTGYQSFQANSPSATATIQISNDGVNYGNGAFGTRLDNGVTINSNLSTGACVSFPVVSKFIRFTAQGGGPQPITIVMRNTPYIPVFNGQSFVNISQVGGNGIAGGGFNGLLGVGGQVANGSSAAGNPMVTGGVDASGLVRRILTDTSGRPFVNTVGNLPAIQNNQGVQSLAVQDLATFEGESGAGLLGLILLELKINNLYLFNLVNQMQSPVGFSPGDEPSHLRDYPSDVDG